MIVSATIARNFNSRYRRLECLKRNEEFDLEFGRLVKSSQLYILFLKLKASICIFSIFEQFPKFEVVCSSLFHYHIRIRTLFK